MSVARYNLRASPASGVGGMYATAMGPNEPIRTTRLGDAPGNEQSWAMLPGDIAQDKYRVCLYDTDNNFSFGWTPAGEEIIPGEPLVLTGDTARHVVWFLKKFDAPDGVANAYTLVADVNIIGATWYAATNEEGLVVVTPLPISPDLDPSSIPYWVLERH